MTLFVQNPSFVALKNAFSKSRVSCFDPSVIAFAFFILISSASPQLTAQDKKSPNNTPPLLKGSALDRRFGNISVARIGTWHRADGWSNHTPLGNDGGTFPPGKLNVIYQDGIIWGGKLFTDPALIQQPPVQGIRVGGTGPYSISTRAGAVTGFGATAQRLPEGNFRVWRIRRNHLQLTTSMLRHDAAAVYEKPVEETDAPEMEEVLKRYWEDWAEWPVQYGAPFIDRNRNGAFDPVAGWEKMDGLQLEELNSDEPGIAGGYGNSPADQVLWMVFNDLDTDQAPVNFGSPPFGFEVQKTVWAYAGGSSYFARYRIINKGGVVVDTDGNKGSFWVDSMYIGQWVDGDIGDAGNDVGGCDPVQNLGFTYNGTDSDFRATFFGVPVAAVVYDLLQGPVIPGSPTDSVLWDFRYVSGMSPLPMLSYVVTGPLHGDRFYVEGYRARMWQSLRGFAATANYFGDRDIPNPAPPGFNPKFSFPSDPESELTTGWLDGGVGAYTGMDSSGRPLSPSPGDRRMIMSSGPFFFAPGDTQEIIIATTAAFGSNRFNAVTEAKRANALAQQAYNDGFQWPMPPVRPNVRTSELDGRVILDWGSDIKRVRATEDEITPVGDYAFEGYNIYQFESPAGDIAAAKRIATFDVKNGMRTIFDRRFVEEYRTEGDVAIQFGTDTGIRRYFVFDKDRIRGIDKLSNGTPYHLAVTAYSVTPYATGYPKALESVPVILTVMPRKPFGTALRADIGDTLQVIPTGGPLNLWLMPVVIDPLAIVPASYDIAIDTASTLPLSISRPDSLVHLPLSPEENAPIFDGIQWKVIPAPGGSDSFVVNTATHASAQDPVSIQQSLARVNVFPNPYYGVNPLETHRFRPFVTFNNLPRRVTVRIFNLAGHLVRVLKKDDESPFLQWNMTNAFNVLVASGIYIAHLEFPDLEQTKILKLSVIQEQVIPETW